ncbi:MAG: ATP-binding protein [Actinomycetota bacterium]|nr:ATP-binding protein [Actinomycetota bacterium]
MSRQVAEPVVETVELLTSEVVTNAIVHTDSSPEVVVRVADEQVRVEVHDGSSAVPVVKRPKPFDPTGRGMTIVDRLARAWGVEHVPAGKRVWFEVPFSAAPLPRWARSLRRSPPRDSTST